MERKAHSRGFTIVELLVVIAIIGILVAILLPAVNMAREAARRSQCGNNMRQLGLAIAGYESQNRRMPPGKIDNGLSGPDRVAHSAVTFLLPFFEEGNVFDRIDFSKSWNNTQANASGFSNDDTTRTVSLGGILICPTAPEMRRQKLFGSVTSIHISAKQVTDYVASTSLGVVGTVDGDTTYNGLVLSDVQRLLGGAISTGVRGMPTADPQSRQSVTRLGSWAGVLQEFRSLSDGAVRTAHVHDGMSKTFLFFEVAGRPDHFVNGKIVAEDRMKTVNWFRWANPDSAIVVDWSCGGGALINCENSEEVYAFHPGGATFVFGDGSVQFLADQMDPEVFVSFYTMAGGDLADRSRL